MKIFEPVGLVLIVVAVLILFGPKRLPDLGRSFGKTMKAFREGTRGDDDEDVEAETPLRSSKVKPGEKESHA